MLSSPYANPGTIGLAVGSSHTGATSTVSGNLHAQNKDSTKEKDIWSPGEVAEGDQYDYDDPREQPV